MWFSLKRSFFLTSLVHGEPHHIPLVVPLNRISAARLATITGLKETWLRVEIITCLIQYAHFLLNASVAHQSERCLSRTGTLIDAVVLDSEWRQLCFSSRAASQISRHWCSRRLTAGGSVEPELLTRRGERKKYKYVIYLYWDSYIKCNLY